MSKMFLRYALDTTKDRVDMVLRYALDNAKNSGHTVSFLRENSVRNLLPLRLSLTGLLI